MWGVQNAVINNLNPIELQHDAGALWENFVIAERIKALKNVRCGSGFYFWRTHQQQEIDYVEGMNRKLHVAEIKRQKRGAGIPKTLPRLIAKQPLPLLHMRI